MVKYRNALRLLQCRVIVLKFIVPAGKGMPEVFSQAAGSRQETASTATPVQPFAAREQRVGARYISITSGSLRQDSHRRSRTLPSEQPRETVPRDRYGLFYQAAEGLRVHNQEASTVAKALVTNFLCRFGVPRELHSDQGRNFESRLMQEVLQRLGVSKARTTPLHPQSDGMVERYIKAVEKHLRKVVTSH
jgi:hypothetical protein